MATRYAERKWAFAIAGFTFRRQIDARLLGVPEDSPAAKAKWATICHAVAVYDLRHRRLAGVCFVPGATPDVPDAHPLVLMAFGAQKLLEAFRADRDTIHFITPVGHGLDMEFLPWLLYAFRDDRLREAIKGTTVSVPCECLLDPVDLFFFGLPTTFDRMADRTVVFPKVPHPNSGSLLVGINFGFVLGGRPLDINFRFCDSGAGKGHAPHIDVETQDRGRPEDRGSPVPGVKVVDHLPVDLEKIRDFELAYSFLAYVGSRPNAKWSQMVGAALLQEHLGLELAMIHDPECGAAVRRVFGDAAEEFPELVRAFNCVSHVDRERSRGLQKEINAEVRRLWATATTPTTRVAITEMVATSQRGLMTLAREQLASESSPTEALEKFLTRGRDVLSALRTWLPPEAQGGAAG